jgi:polyhydroxyalkanoate synthase
MSVPAPGGKIGKAWIEGIDATRVKKRRRPGGTKLKPIEDAPGSYVMVRV